MWIGLMAVVYAADPFDVEAEVHTLDNGLTVILSEDHNTDNISLHLHYGVGARDEGEGEYGCAHLFEHLMFEGSKNVPTNAFDTWLTDAGGWNNAFTSDDETAYHETFPSGALELALMLESDRMGFLDAGLDEENLANQQKVVLQERAEGYDEPGGRNWDAINLIAYPEGHPYQHTVIGTVADIEGYTVERVTTFWKNHYRPRNAVLSLVGNFKTAEALAAVEHWFSDVPDVGDSPERAEPVTFGPEIRGDHMITDNVDNRTLYMAWPTVPRYHEDEPALDMLGRILSGGPGTRLDDALQYKKNVLSGVGAFGSNNEIAGHFIVIGVSDDLALPVVKKKIDKQLAKFAKLPPTTAELERAKKGMRASLLSSLEGLEDRAESLVDCQRFTGDANCMRAEYARYEPITPDDVMRVYEKYLVPEHLVTLSVVPDGGEGTLEGAKPVEIK